MSDRDCTCDILFFFLSCKKYVKLSVKCMSSIRHKGPPFRAQLQVLQWSMVCELNRVGRLLGRYLGALQLWQVQHTWGGKSKFPRFFCFSGSTWLKAMKTPCALIRDSYRWLMSWYLKLLTSWSNPSPPFLPFLPSVFGCPPGTRLVCCARTAVYQQTVRQEHAQLHKSSRLQIPDAHFLQ